MSARPIAIVGGGIGGSVCAALLRMFGRNVRVFAGGNAVGGRASSERHVIEGKTGPWHLQFDAGAQFLQASDPRVVRLLAHSSFDGCVPYIT